MRPARQKFLSSLDHPWSKWPCSVVTTLVLLNVLAYVAQWSFTRMGYGDWIDNHLALSLDGLRHGEIWQVVSYMFLHQTPYPLHLMFNMILLFFAGREIEPIVDKKTLLLIYFGGGILGGLVQAFSAWPASPDSLIGASAGVCAVVLAFTTIYPELELIVLIFLIIPVKMRAKYFALLLVGVSALFSWLQYFGPIGHLAHLGGAAFGWIIARSLGFGTLLPFQKRRLEQKQRESRLRMMPADQFICEEIDPILEKIAREGLKNLTREERKILEAGREKIERRPPST